jgi:inosose dehydratase
MVETATANFVGAQLYGWAQYYERKKESFSEHLDETLAALAEADYDFAEGFLDVEFPENNARFAARLKSKGLRPVSMYAGVKLHDADQAPAVIEKVLTAAKICRQAGFLLININPDSAGREKTDDELRTQATSLDELGRELNKLDLILGVHNHLPEMLHGAREFRGNLRRTDRAHVGLCFDVHWIYRGGLAPIAALRDYADRVVSWHLRQSRDNVWLEELADGDINYPEVAEFVREHGYLGPYTVELAVEEGSKLTRSIVENHRRSREYVRQVFGV